MHSSLSSFLRATTENHFEGPIPAMERDRIRIVEGAEQAFDRSLPPLERSLRSLAAAYGDVLRDSALVEASRQLQAEGGQDATGRVGLESGRHADLYRRRVVVLGESAAWLVEKARQLTELARREAKHG